MPSLRECHYRHAVYYLYVAMQAGELCNLGREEVIRGLELFDMEWKNIHAGQSWAASHCEDEDVSALCSTYPNVVEYYLDRQRHPHERIRWLNAALVADRRLNDRVSEGVHRRDLGSAYFALGKALQASECYQQALAVARDTGDAELGNVCLSDLANVLANLGDRRAAMECYQASLMTARSVGNRRGEASALSNLGVLYANVGDLQQAIEHYKEALIIAKELGDHLQEAKTLGHLG